MSFHLLPMHSSGWCAYCNLCLFLCSLCNVQDASGEIDLNELRTVMTSLGYSPTDKQLEDMMAKASNTNAPQVVVVERRAFKPRH